MTNDPSKTHAGIIPPLRTELSLPVLFWDYHVGKQYSNVEMPGPEVLRRTRRLAHVSLTWAQLVRLRGHAKEIANATESDMPDGAKLIASARSFFRRSHRPGR